MLKTLWTTLKNLAASRKVMLAAISGIIYLLGRAGINATQADLLPIMIPLWGALFGTAAEDVARHIAAGKAAANPLAATIVSSGTATGSIGGSP